MIKVIKTILLTILIGPECTFDNIINAICTNKRNSRKHIKIQLNIKIGVLDCPLVR